MLVDTHAHIYSEIYSDIDRVIKNSMNFGVNKIINCADNIKNAEEIVSLSKEYEGVLYCAVGIHPENVSDYKKEDIKHLESLAKHKNVVAIGEIGLDYYYSEDNREVQIQMFKDQLNLAQKLNLPVIIHSRESSTDIIKILKNYKLKGIIHCFTEDEEVAKEYIDLGYLLGIGGILTFKNSKLREVIKKIGLEYIVLETDSPFLTPEPFRKYKNEPKYIVEVSKYLAQLYDCSSEEIANITSQNLSRIFDF